MNRLPPVPVPAGVWWREFRTRALLPLLSLAALLTVGHLWRQTILSNPPPSSADQGATAQDGYLVGMKVDGHHSHKKSVQPARTNMPFPTPLVMTNSAPALRGALQ